MKRDLKIFSDKIEPGAINQMYEAMRHDSVIRGALMPDAHTGYSLPIGGVVLTKDYIFPAWVGYDIGCGMCAAKTEFKRRDVEKNANRIFDRIYEMVPVGFNHHSERNTMWKAGRENMWVAEVVPRTSTLEEIYLETNAHLQIGTLGGGNHFIEIGYDEDDVIWLIVHSGSRGFGYKVAQHYMKLASPTGKASEGNWGFDIVSKEGQDYWKDMNFCLHYALENRKNIMLGVEYAIRDIIKGGVTYRNMINRNHNHATSAPEGEGIIHRKGATHAELGMGGVIPGNMRDGSFIVRGLGNPDGLWSSSHGAGRVLGRKKAKERLSVRDFEKTMGNVTAKVCKDTLDESPFAYKDIFEVMDLQSTLVEVIAHVKPIINIKG